MRRRNNQTRLKRQFTIRYTSTKKNNIIDEVKMKNRREVGS